MPFAIPDQSTAAFGFQAMPDPVDFSILSLGSGGSGVVSGCAVTAGSGLSVNVASGTILSLGTQQSVAGGNLVLGANGSGNPRIDLVVATSAGAIAARAGTAGTTPLFAALSAGDVALAAVTIPAGASSLTASNIISKSVPVRVATGAVTVEDEGTTLGSATALNFVGAGVVATYSASGSVGTVTVSGAGAGSQTVWSYNVLDYGLVGDGATDNTIALSNLFNTTIGTKPAVVIFPAIYNNTPATYIVNSLTMPAGAQLTIWGYGATVKHKSGAGGHMLIGAFGAAPSYLNIMGLTLDGNFAGQSANYNLNLISTYLALGGVFRDVLFTHWSRHAFELIDATQTVTLDNCRFVDGNEWGNAKAGLGPGNDTTACEINNTHRFNLVFDKCEFIQTTVTTAGASPGGISIAGDNTNTQPLVANVTNCYFKNTGFRSIVGGVSTQGQVAAGVYMYRVADGSKIIGNTIENPYFTGITVTASCDVEVANNVIFANNLLSDSGGGYGMSVQGHDHQSTVTPTNPVKRVTFHDNILTYRFRGGGGTSAPATQAFYIDSVAGQSPSELVSEIILHDNHVDDFAVGVQLLQSTGSVSIHDNTFRSLTANGIQITDSVAGHLKIASNDFLGTAFAAITFPNQLFSSLELDVLYNYFENTSSSLVLMGNRVKLLGNTWVGTPSSAPIATIGQSGNVVAVAIVSGNMSSIAAPIVHTNCTTYIQLANTNQGNWT